MNEKDLAALVRSLVEQDLHRGDAAASRTVAAPSAGQAPKPVAGPIPSFTPPTLAEGDEALLAKRVALWMGRSLPPPPMLGPWKKAGDGAFYRSRTPARLGVGRAGTRYRTETLLAFQADHAAARDAVVSALDSNVLSKLGFVELHSAAADKREFLIRPDLGRRLSADAEATVNARGIRKPQVQIVAADGLSAAAVNANLPLVFPELVSVLSKAGLRLGTPFAIHNGRVASADSVARLVDADVLCLLVGERPGLKTAESMGAYVTWFRVRDFNESKRSVISNIHAGGLVPVEGARQVAALVVRAIREKKTGIEQA
jgi:ethanolamine ammonia-lyase small subunit